MIDKNGIEIKTGDVVEITGAFFKNDNGLYFVEHSAGDPDWCGSDHSLRKISKKGKISTAKYNIGFWPIMITTNSWEKRIEARSWNSEHAEIEVKRDIDRSEIAKHFQEEAENMDSEIKRIAWSFGEDNPQVLKNKAIKEHYNSVSNRILAEA
jgi:hypothetical protein